MASEPVERLSEVLNHLQDMADMGDSPAMSRQIEVLRDVQRQMQLQLALHDAQIAALREVIDLLTGRAAS